MWPDLWTQVKLLRKINVAWICNTRSSIFGTSLTQVPHSSCSSNAVDVFLDVAGQVKVDDMLHIGDVQTPSGNLGKPKKQRGTLHTGHKWINVRGKKVAKVKRSLTAVATRMGHFPDRNWLRASSRSRCERSPWMLVQAYPSRYKKSSKASAPFLVSTNTRVSESLPDRWKKGCRQLLEEQPLRGAASPWEFQVCYRNCSVCITRVYKLNGKNCNESVKYSIQNVYNT